MSCASADYLQCGTRFIKVRPLACARVVAASLFDARASGTALGRRRLFFYRRREIPAVVSPDRGRKHGEIDPLAAIVARLRAAAAFVLVTGTAMGAFAARLGPVVSGA